MEDSSSDRVSTILFILIGSLVFSLLVIAYFNNLKLFDLNYRVASSSIEDKTTALSSKVEESENHEIREISTETVKSLILVNESAEIWLNEQCIAKGKIVASDFNWSILKQGAVYKMREYTSQGETVKICLEEVS